MKIKFLEPEVKAGKKYHGEIVRYTLDEEHRVFRVFVVLNKEPNLEFMKRYEFDQSVYSHFAGFCFDMGIYADDEIVDLDELIGTKVIVKLKEGKDQKLYIGKIELNDDYYLHLEDCNEE